MITSRLLLLCLSAVSVLASPLVLETRDPAVDNIVYVTDATSHCMIMPRYVARLYGICEFAADARFSLLGTLIPILVTLSIPEA